MSSSLWTTSQMGVLQVYATPHQKGQTVVTSLAEGMFTSFGAAETIHSEQGRNFESAVFSAMCEQLGMQKSRTTPLHLQRDGLMEG